MEYVAVLNSQMSQIKDSVANNNKNSNNTSADNDEVSCSNKARACQVCGDTT